MRYRRETLGTCMAKAKGKGGEDWDTLPHSLKRGTQKGSPWPAVSPSRLNTTAVDGNGNTQSEALSWETKDGLSEAGLLLPTGDRVLLYLKGSMGRNSALAAVPSKAVGLSPVPASVPVGECLAVLSHGIKEALQRDWPGRGPGTTDSHRGQCSSGEPWVSAQPGHLQLWEVEVSKGEPVRAFPEWPGSELELSCLCSLLPDSLHARPQSLLKDETRCDHLDQLKPVLSEQTTEYRNMLLSINCTSNGLQITLGLLAL
ncbi:protein FAM220A [Erethizon dorsatum]